MANKSPKPLQIEVELPGDHPQLLAGLEQWLALGLISHAQVRSLCARHLSCDVVALLQEAMATQEAVADKTSEMTQAIAQTSVSQKAASNDFQPARFSHPLGSWMQQLMGELSVVWLLGLGVFLVVLSSAVLAATQWAQFNRVGQYLVLLAYTVIFWGAGWWSANNPQLRLTSKTLQIISLMLVPLNFWAMDGLGVLAGNWLVGAGAVILLGVLSYCLMRQWLATVAQSCIFLGLGLLQLGWTGLWPPVMALYLGVLLAAAWRRLQARNPVSEVSFWPVLLLNFSLGILLLRGLATIPFSNWGQLGLAFGIYGAGWVWFGMRQTHDEEPETESETLDAIEETRNGIADHWSRRFGQGLLWWGWLIAIESWPAQALGVSILGLGLRLERLWRRPRRRNLLMAFAIALQLPFVAWRLLPSPWQQALVMPLAQALETTGNPDWLLGISLYPYVVVLVAIADIYDRRRNASMGRFSEGLAVSVNLVLMAISSFAPAVLVVNLIASTITSLAVTLRCHAVAWRIYTSHGLALLTTVLTIDHLWPNLGDDRWLLISFGLTAINLLLSRWLPTLWSRSAWLFGLGLAGLAYGLLWDHLLAHQFQSFYSLLGLTIPLLMTVLGRADWSFLGIGLTAPLTLGLPVARLVGLGSATGISAANSYLSSRLSSRFPMVLLTVGLGIGFTVSLVNDLIPAFPPSSDYWYGILAFVVVLLWGIRWLLARRHARGIAFLYGQASDYWGRALSVSILLALTIEVGLLYSDGRSPLLTYGVGTGLLLVAGLLRLWEQPQPWTLYLLGWICQLLAAEGVVAFGDGSLLSLSIVTVALGAVTLGLTLLVQRRFPVHHLRILSMIYGLLSLAFRVNSFNAWTGWIVLVTALLGIEISRHVRWGWLRWLSLLGISLGWYELVLYQLSQSTGEHLGDGFVVLAAVATVIMLAYRLSANWLERRLRLPTAEMMVAAHIHWVVASLLMVWAGWLVSRAGVGQVLPGLGVGLVLILYSLAQGRSSSSSLRAFWIYSGLTEIVGWFAYWRLAVPTLGWLDDWWVGIACGFGVLFYWGPWQRYGWSQLEWQRFAIALPIAITLLTGSGEHLPSLIMLVGFYGLLAWRERSVRLSYLSVAAMVWTAWTGLEIYAISDQLAYVLPLGLAGLYAAQLDPGLESAENQAGRHWLRLFSLAIILFVALFSERWTGLPVGIVSLLVIALGLWLKVRAYLFTATLVFALNGLNQLIWLNSEYPLMKWVLGFVVGIGLIWVAANFERRRQQWSDLTQTWFQQLQTWE